MCGIAGAVFVTNFTEDSLSGMALRMMDALQHRGPDDCGYYIDTHKGLLLTHRRLAIQDLSNAGKQPMVSHSGRYTVVFNGEIYNFRQLSHVLESLDHVFTGHSDTEVLLAAIESWGIEAALQKFSGMFAFALWDSRKKVLHLARDRMGEKPLYYGWVGNNFYFASELKALETIIPKAALSLDMQALGDYFKFGYINAPLSVYKGIYKLMPGTMLAITAASADSQTNFSPLPAQEGFSPRLYWSLLDAANAGLKQLFLDESEAIAELDSQLHRTVSEQLSADVAVGTFLSGGIDSTLVSAIAQAESVSSVKTFTIGYEESDYDESGFAERIAQHLGTEHTAVRLSARDSLAMVPEISRIYDEPFADSSQIPAYLVSKIARRDVTVCLSGDGGDELFAGYNRYNWSDSIWRKIRLLPLPLRQLLSSVLRLAGTGGWDDFYRRLSAALALDQHSTQRMVGLKLQKLGEFITRRDLYDAYTYLLSYWDRPDLLLQHPGRSSEHIAHQQLPMSDLFLDHVLYMDQTSYLPGDNLAKIDRASMAVSLETRLPLLDHRLVELSWRVPASMKVRGSDTKWLMKQVLYRYVPRELVERPKMGFSVPVAQWLRNDLLEWATDLLGSKDNSGYGMLNQKLLKTVWNEHLGGKRDHSLKLWSVLMFLSWAER